MLVDEDEFSLDFELDEVTIGDAKASNDKEEDEALPKNYLLLENLILLEQVKGLGERNEDLMQIPAYAPRAGGLALVGLVELTAANIMAMQRLKLKVSIIKKDSEPILFDKVEHYIDLIKTLKEDDKVDYTDDSLYSNYDEQPTRRLSDILGENEESEEVDEELGVLGSHS